MNGLLDAILHLPDEAPSWRKQRNSRCGLALGPEGRMEEVCKVRMKLTSKEQLQLKSDSKSRLKLKLKLSVKLKLELDLTFAAGVKSKLKLKLKLVSRLTAKLR